MDTDTDTYIYIYMQTNYTGIFIHVDLHTYIHQVHPYIHTYNCNFGPRYLARDE